MSLRDFMRLAIEEAKIGGTPYGCVIVKGKHVIVQAYDTTKTENDPTAQAEINAIRKLCTLFQPEERTDCILFTTCEPSPMSMSAIVYAGIRRVIFGVPLEKVTQFNRPIKIKAKEIISNSPKDINIKGGKLQEECLELFKMFANT